MMTTRRMVSGALGAAAWMLACHASAVADDATEETPTAPCVDIALCLDTSGSMDGLLDSARQKLWSIVNDLALAEPEPQLRVALLTFGNDGLDPAQGWVAVQSPLTSDLDRISEVLFAQTTNGGTELVGRVVQSAVDGLEWGEDESALRLMFVAGNEGADQDQEVTYQVACKAAIERGIVVNSIYCGDPNDTLAPVWADVARRADGHAAAIDPNTGTVVIETPHDEMLSALNDELNKTYLPFGAEGMVGGANQIAQDWNAAGLNSEAIACRAQSKASNLYKCGWDLVDALEQKQVVLADVAKEELPEAMREMTPAQCEAYLESKRGSRAALQKKIQEVGALRDAFVQAELARLEGAGDRSFDRAVRAAVRAQAESKGLRFRDAAVAAAGGGA